MNRIAVAVQGWLQSDALELLATALAFTALAFGSFLAAALAFAALALFTFLAARALFALLAADGPDAAASPTSIAVQAGRFRYPPAGIFGGPGSTALYRYDLESREEEKLLDGVQDFVLSSAQIGTTLRVLVRKDLEKPERLIAAAIEAAGLHAARCALTEANLEDVFVASTRRRTTQ